MLCASTAVFLQRGFNWKARSFAGVMENLARLTDEFVGAPAACVYVCLVSGSRTGVRAVD